MKDMALAWRRAIEGLVDWRAALILFGSGALWTLLNTLTSWLLLGPALVALFRITLKEQRGIECDFKRDNLAVLDDPATPWVAGVLFVLPFQVWGLLNNQAGVLEDLVKAVAHVARGSSPEAAESISNIQVHSIPFFATAALLIHFAYHVMMFPLLSERRATLAAAAREARELAERPGGGRLHGFGRHLVFTFVVFLGVLLAAWSYSVHDVMGWLVMSVLGPLVIAVLASWYRVLIGESSETETIPREPAEPDVS